MRELVFLLEEDSAKALLESLLPRLLSADFPCRFIAFEGKQDLERQMVKRIRGYQNPEARFCVLAAVLSIEWHSVDHQRVLSCTSQKIGCKK